MVCNNVYKKINMIKLIIKSGWFVGRRKKVHEGGRHAPIRARQPSCLAFGLCNKHPRSPTLLKAAEQKVPLQHR